MFSLIYIENKSNQKKYIQNHIRQNQNDDTPYPTAQPREGTAGVGMISRWLLTGEAGVKPT